MATGVLGRVVGRVSSRAALGGFALSEVALRTLGALDGVTAAAVVGVLYRQVPWVLLGNAAAAALYATAFYEFAPRLYARGDVERRRDLDALVAVVASAFGLLAGLLREGDAVLAVGAVVGVGLPAATVAFAAYFRAHGETLLDPAGTPVGIADGFFPDDAAAAARETRRGDGTVGAWRRNIRRVVVVLPLVLGSVLFGFVGFVLGALYPVPELLVLGWVGYGAVAARTRVPGEARPSLGHVDLETRFYRAVAAGTSGLAGVARVVLGLAGLLASGVPLTVGVAVAVPLVREFEGGALFAWTDAGVLALLAAAGAYGVWFWVRAFDRLPAYIDRCTDADVEAVPEPPARVVGLGVPPALAMATIALAARSFDATATRVAFAAAWPALVAVHAATVPLTRRASQPVGSDGWAVPVTMGVTFVGVTLAAFPAWVDALLAGRPVVPGELVAAVGIVAVLALLGPLDRRLPETVAGIETGWLVLVGVGVGALVGRRVVADSGVGTVLLGVGVLALLAGTGGIVRGLYAGEDA